MREVGDDSPRRDTTQLKSTSNSLESEEIESNLVSSQCGSHQPQLPSTKVTKIDPVPCGSHPGKVNKQLFHKSLASGDSWMTVLIHTSLTLTVSKGFLTHHNTL